MKVRLPLLFLCACLGVMLGSVSVDSSDGFFINQNSILPNINYSFDDLDARDSQNCSLKTLAVQNNLKEIFQAGLFVLIVESDIRSMADALAAVNRKLNLSGFAFVKNLFKLFAASVLAVLPGVKEFKNLLTLLTGFLALNILCLSFVVLSSKTLPSTSRMIPLVLRC